MNLRLHAEGNLLMDMSDFRPDLHVAQQSRRDKMRVQQEVYIENSNQFPSHEGSNYKPSNISYNPSEFCSEMINFPVNEPHKRAVESFLGNFSRTNFNPTATMSSNHQPQCFNTWKSIGSQSGCDNWAPNDQGPVFVDDGPLKIMNKAYIGYQDLQSQAFNNNPSTESSSLYLQELVSSSNVRSLGHEFDHQWSGHNLDFSAIKNTNRDLRIVANENSNNTQALCLSLSSVPSPKVHSTQMADRDTSAESRSKNVYNIHENPDNLHSKNARQDLIHRNHGPLGPFTGYATILKSSKFLRPAEQLLDEHCNIARSKHVEIGENGRVSGDSSGSSFLCNGLNDESREAGSMSTLMGSHSPKNHQNKTKLLFMQDEVCKRYKQYNQQMQMVVSSFESVAGLSAATPYVSLALKMVSNNFRCIKNAIIDQLKSLRNAFGEDLSAPNIGTSKDDTNVSMLKFIDQSFHKQKGAANLGEGQHVWRPQRGLPERAVAILRAWLFDHFLHPYPTDTDKHMLATQTGLTRNQVSNWFINARVRVWKPMVEEIHMLETKGATQTGLNVANPTTDGCDRSISSSDKQVEISQSERSNPSIWNQEKRSRFEYNIPTGVEIGGLGAVSLTLGLRQSAESAAQRAPLQRFGGQIIRDYVG